MHVETGKAIARPHSCPQFFFNHVMQPCFAVEPSKRPTFGTLVSQLMEITSDLCRPSQEDADDTHFPRAWYRRSSQSESSNTAVMLGHASELLSQNSELTDGNGPPRMGSSAVSSNQSLAAGAFARSVTLSRIVSGSLLEKARFEGDGISQLQHSKRSHNSKFSSGVLHFSGSHRVNSGKHGLKSRIYTSRSNQANIVRRGTATPWQADNTHDLAGSVSPGFGSDREMKFRGVGGALLSSAKTRSMVSGSNGASSKKYRGPKAPALAAANSAGQPKSKLVPDREHKALASGHVLLSPSINSNDTEDLQRSSSSSSSRVVSHAQTPPQRLVLQSPTPYNVPPSSPLRRVTVPDGPASVQGRGGASNQTTVDDGNLFYSPFHRPSILLTMSNGLEAAMPASGVPHNLSTNSPARSALAHAVTPTGLASQIVTTAFPIQSPAVLSTIHMKSTAPPTVIYSPPVASVAQFGPGSALPPQLPATMISPGSGAVLVPISPYVGVAPGSFGADVLSGNMGSFDIGLIGATPGGLAPFGGTENASLAASSSFGACGTPFGAPYGARRPAKEVFFPR
jgi:hypothetical protein